MTTVALFGILAMVALIFATSASFVEDFRRTRRAAAARPTREARDQSERIRNAYMSKEQRAREMRERIRRERVRRERARAAAGYRTRPNPETARNDASSDRPSVPRAPSPEDHYRTTLELVGEVTPERLRINYRRLVAAYHPDRVSGLGVKLQRLAEEETKAINEAYSYFKRRLGL